MGWLWPGGSEGVEVGLYIQYRICTYCEVLQSVKGLRIVVHTVGYVVILTTCELKVLANSNNQTVAIATPKAGIAQRKCAAQSKRRNNLHIVVQKFNLTIRIPCVALTKLQQVQQSLCLGQRGRIQSYNGTWLFFSPYVFRRSAPRNT